MTADRAARSRRRRRTAIALVAVIAATGVTAGVVAGISLLRPKNAAAASASSVSTAPVVRTDIVNTIQVSALLGYAGSYTIANQEQGTAYTWLPAVGTVIQRGHEAYEVDGNPVTLFYGQKPEWRALSWGVTPGADVAQLDRNLIALGYGASLTVSDYYTDETFYAVELWQQAAGLPVTGTVPLGQVAFAPGPVRVTSVTPALGNAPQPGGTVLTATSPIPLVTGLLPVTQEYLVHVGNQVTVTLPDGVTTTPGTVTGVSTVAASGSGAAGTPSGSPSSSSGGNTPDSVTMTVDLTHPRAVGNLDGAPVTVNVISAQARDVLAVPVSALVALAGGGYAVDVIDGTGPHATGHLAPVQAGLFSSTLVQVTGPGLAVGQRVEVPSP
jgi:Putative peptidoglycan binding domain